MTIHRKVKVRKNDENHANGGTVFGYKKAVQ